MSFLAFLSKIPWGFLIKKSPDIVEAVKNFRHKQELPQNNTQEQPGALERLVIEQSHLLSSLSDQISINTAEINEMKKQLSVIFVMLIAIGAGVVTLIGAMLFVYSKM